MSQYVLKQNGVIYKVDIKHPTDLSDFIVGPVQYSNDRFTKYTVTVNLEGSIIKIDDATDEESNDIICTYTLNTETYEEYLQKKMNVNIKNVQWIYNIIDKLCEQENILYRDDECVIIPTYTWNGDVNKLHILGIGTDKSIMTLRDLGTDNIPMLEHIREKGLEYIKKIYNIDKCMIRVYIHYPPSTWSLHIHFELISNITSSCVTEYCHNLSQVIYNLKLDNNYYKNLVMDILTR